MLESSKKEIKKRQTTTIHKLKGFIGNKEKELSESKHKEATNAYLREYNQDFKEINQEKRKSKELINVETMRKIDSTDPFLDRQPYKVAIFNLR